MPRGVPVLLGTARQCVKRLRDYTIRANRCNAQLVPRYKRMYPSGSYSGLRITGVDNSKKKSYGTRLLTLTRLMTRAIKATCRITTYRIKKIEDGLMRN